jgi:hypothetical protein
MTANEVTASATSDVNSQRLVPKSCGRRGERSTLERGAGCGMRRLRALPQGTFDSSCSCALWSISDTCCPSARIVAWRRRRRSAHERARKRGVRANAAARLDFVRRLRVQPVEPSQQPARPRQHAVSARAALRSTRNRAAHCKLRAVLVLQPVHQRVPHILVQHVDPFLVPDGRHRGGEGGVARPL